jgi:hypothetical protein
VNERNLSRTLSTNVVDALKSQGHILVVKGGATALAREFEDLMAPLLGRIAQLTPRIEPLAIVGGEVTSTFGHEAIDEMVEEMVATLTRALMDSDHVEDVFAEDNVIRRDIFRAVRDGLREPALADASGDDDPSVRVQLDTLGYVAATVSRLCDPKTLREALGRAAEVAMAHFTAYQHEARAATFVLQDDDPDGRLELEEAIADELTDLVEDGKVELPTIERRIDLGRDLSPAEQRAARPRIDVAGQETLLSTGCAATWEFDGGRTLRVTFTPLSDQDTRNVDRLVSDFAREVAQIRGLSGAPRAGTAPEPRRLTPALASTEDEDERDELEGAVEEDDLEDEERDEDEDEDEDIEDAEDAEDIEDAEDEGPASAPPAADKRVSRAKAKPAAAPAAGGASPARASSRSTGALRSTASKRAAPKRTAAAPAARRTVKATEAPEKAASSRKTTPAAKATAAKGRKAPAKKR